MRAIVAVSTYETEKKERNEKWTNPPKSNLYLFSYAITKVEIYLGCTSLKIIFCLDVYLNKSYDADMEAKGKGKYIIVNIKVISITINSFHLLKKKKNKLYI